MGKTVEVKSYKFPDHIHYEWKGELLIQTEDYVLIHCAPNRELVHHTKGKTFHMKNESYEFFSLKEGFTAAMTVEDGRIVSYYCNVANPSVFKDGVITFVDLDLDYVKRKVDDWVIVDEDEFLENSKKYGYSKELIAFAINELKKLQEKVKNKEFPFNLKKEEDILKIVR